MLTSGYAMPWATVGGTLTANASNFYSNSKGWYSFSQNKFYGLNFNGNQYTALPAQNNQDLSLPA